MTPTPEDLVRNLAADLALCETATKGPWRHCTSSHGDACICGLIHSESADRCVATVNVDRCEVQDHGASAPLTEESKANQRMVAATRDGWPVAIRRALAAEAGVDELEKQLAVAEKLIEKRNQVLDALRCPIHGQCVPYALEKIRQFKKAAPKILRQ